MQYAVLVEFQIGIFFHDLTSHLHASTDHRLGHFHVVALQKVPCLFGELDGQQRLALFVRAAQSDSAVGKLYDLEKGCRHCTSPVSQAAQGITATLSRPPLTTPAFPRDNARSVRPAQRALPAPRRSPIPPPEQPWWQSARRRQQFGMGRPRLRTVAPRPATAPPASCHHPLPVASARPVPARESVRTDHRATPARHRERPATASDNARQFHESAPTPRGNHGTGRAHGGNAPGSWRPDQRHLPPPPRMSEPDGQMRVPGWCGYRSHSPYSLRSALGLAPIVHYPALAIVKRAPATGL